MLIAAQPLQLMLHINTTLLTLLTLLTVPRSWKTVPRSETVLIFLFFYLSLEHYSSAHTLHIFSNNTANADTSENERLQVRYLCQHGEQMEVISHI